MTNKRENLRPLGWSDYFECQLAEINSEESHIARVTSVQRNLFSVNDGHNEGLCSLAGKLLHSGEHPVTGDWVLVEDKIITAIVPRRNILSRGEAGGRGHQRALREQAIAANLDRVFIVCGLDRDYNLRRIERYLTLIYNCGIKPVVVLTKADLHDNPEACRMQVEEVAFGVPVILTSISDEMDRRELEIFLASGQTVATVGSSGAGKSTLINLLSGREVQLTAAISSSVGKGRHTTTIRELISMPQGGLLMDNPGIREIAFYDDGDGLDTTFADIQELAEACRFADCSHRHEPGCAVVDAVDRGDLQAARLESFHKMQREMEFISERRNKSADRIEKERWQDVSRLIKQIKKR